MKFRCKTEDGYIEISKEGEVFLNGTNYGNNYCFSRNIPQGVDSISLTGDGKDKGSMPEIGGVLILFDQDQSLSYVSPPIIEIF